MDSQPNTYLIPASIIVAGALIAFAVFYTNGPGSGAGNLAAIGDSFENSLSDAASENMRPVDGSDHIFGNPNAPVKLVEYSDLECPFCKRFHFTMQEVMNKYGKDGQVAWVYRHFPLDSIHSKARKEAEASECAAELGGNTGFWNFVDLLFEITPSNNGFDLAKLPDIAEDVGLNRASFESCLESGRHAERVDADLEDAISAGGRGTPHSVVVTENGNFFPFSGALEFSQVENIIEQAFASLE